MKTNILNSNQNNLNRWIVSYADFITMLLALFMVLFALSQPNDNNLKNFSQSLNRAFNVKNSTNTTPQLNLNEKTKLIKIFQTTETFVYNYAETPSKKEIKQVKEIKTEEELKKFLQETMQKEFINGNNIKVLQTDDGVLIKLNHPSKNAAIFSKISNINENSKNSDIINQKPAKDTDNPDKVGVQKQSQKKAE